MTSDIFIALIGSMNVGGFGLLIKIYFMVGEIKSTMGDHNRRLNNLEKKHA